MAQRGALVLIKGPIREKKAAECSLTLFPLRNSFLRCFNKTSQLRTHKLLIWIQIAYSFSYNSPNRKKNLITMFQDVIQIKTILQMTNMI